MTHHFDLPDLPPGAPPPPPTTPTGTVNDVAGPTERTLSVAAMGAPVRITYGEVRLPGQIFFAHFAGAYAYIGYEFGLGEIEGFQTIYLDGVAVLTGGAHEDSRTPSGYQASNITQYHGTATQAVPLSSIIPMGGYADNLRIDYDGTTYGVAYLVLRLAAWESDVIPNVEAVLRGRHVWDPRLDSGAGDSAWTQNPALILNDLQSNTLYGQGLSTDMAALEDVADDNDEIVPTTSDPRHTLNLVLDRPRPASEWADVIAGDYASCFIVPDGDGVKLVSDRPASSSRSFTAADVIQQGGKSSLRSAVEGLSRAPTVVQVMYTDTATEPWSEGRAEALATGVATNAVPRRIQKLRLPGIHNHEEAYRAAVVRLNKQILTRETVQFIARDKAIEQQVGDVVTLTHWRGYSAVPFRVRTAEIVGPGRWRIGMRLYDASVYSDAVQAGPSQNAGSAEDPFDPPAVASVTAVEEIVRDADGRAVSSLLVTFAAVDWPFVREYAIEAVGAGQVHEWTTGHANDEAEVATRRIIARATHQQPDGDPWAVRLYTVSSAGGVRSTAAGTTLTVLGSYRRPPDVSGLTAVFEAGVLTLEWDPVLDIEDEGRIGYQVRFAATDAGWSTAVKAHRGWPTETRFQMREFPADDDDTYYFYVKAKDGVGKRSENAARLGVEIDPALTENRRTMVISLWAEDFTLDGMFADYVCGEGEFLVTTVGAATHLEEWQDRIGTSGAWSNAADEWYKHHVSYFSQVTHLGISDYADFDAGSDRMAEVSVQVDSTYLPSTSSGTVSKFIQVTSDTYGAGAGSFSNAFVQGMRSARCSIGIWDGQVDWGSLTDDIVLMRMPAKMKMRELESIQGATLTGLDETDLASDYSITFDPPYLAAPRFQFHAGSTDESVVVTLKSLSATTAVLRKFAGPATFSWDLSWNTIGQ